MQTLDNELFPSLGLLPKGHTSPGQKHMYQRMAAWEPMVALTCLGTESPFPHEISKEIILSLGL